MKWYILYTTPRAEKQVEQRLKKNGIETFLPLHLSPRRWSDRVKLIEVPLFSSYLFVRTTDHIVRSLVVIPGVSRIVFYDGRPAEIREDEIESIHSFLELARAREVSFSIDEEVLVVCGPLKDWAGKIKKIGKEQFILYIEQLGAMVSVATNQVIKQ